MKKHIILLSLFLMLVLTACNKKTTIIKTYDVSDSVYKDESMWCINENNNKSVDTFFICPSSKSGNGNMDLSLEVNTTAFKGAILMEKGIYDTETNFIAPYYHQVLLDDYGKSEEELEKSLSIAYDDIKSAFEYYLMKINNGHKIILAGFSEGADMCLRLLKDYINDDSFYEKYIACYAIGWIVTNDYLNKNERLKMAESSDDLKCIISFNTESEDIESSFIVGKNEYSNSINPLSWKRDNNVVDKSYNEGAVFYNTHGEITKEIPNMTGCYIDQKRGTLKVTDIDSKEYTTKKNFMPEGLFHLWDYQFFYNNLKNNVITRIEKAK